MACSEMGKISTPYYRQHRRNEALAFNYGNTLIAYLTLPKHVKVLFEQFTPCENVLSCIVKLGYAFEVLIYSMSSACFKRVLNDLLQHQS